MLVVSLISLTPSLIKTLVKKKEIVCLAEKKIKKNNNLLFSGCSANLVLFNI